jgi:ribonuclease R
MDKLQDGDEVYRYSRLLLPKMAKANYSEKALGHFGLALDFYAHFTSPIRRYPDLQVHRIIKEKLRGLLSRERISHYKALLPKVAKRSSERERRAEDLERAFDALYACRYMRSHVGETFSGRVSGLSEFAIFIELENSIEVTVYLPRGKKYTPGNLDGHLYDVNGKILHSLGEKVSVRILDVLQSERRVVGEVVE